jgi:hypothetical protein
LPSQQITASGGDAATARNCGRSSNPVRESQKDEQKQ